MATPLPAFFKRKTDRIRRIGEPSCLSTLSSQRLNLCWIDHADVTGIYHIYSDSKVTRYWNQAAFSHQDDAHIYIESIHHGFDEGKLFEWGICTKGSQTLIGTCSLSNISTAQGSANIEMAISSAHWGHGYGCEALDTLIKHAFCELGLRRLEADVNPHNASYLKAMEILGFKREGYLRQRWQVAGELQDSVVLSLLKSDSMYDVKTTEKQTPSASASLG